MRNSKLKNGLLLAGAVVTCPCHLPLWAGLLAGTALGAFLSQHFTWVFAAFAAAFILSLSYGLRLWFKEPS